MAMEMNTAPQDGFCDKQPVVQGGIQTFGVLLVLSTDLRILQASVNAEESLGIPCAQLVGKDLSELLSPGDCQALEIALNDGDAHRPSGWELELTGASGPKRFEASLSARESYLLLELEHVEGDEDPLPAVMIRNLLTRLSIDLMHCRTFSEMYDKATAELKSILALDKVMIYQFDENWHGAVLSEAKEAEMDSYLGLHFPATDIPEPARRLYASSPIRMIPDAGHAVVRLEPALNPLTGKPSDLGACVLRGVAPVHLEYLKNMQVTASISVSVMHKGVLWGLIAMHHRAPKVLHASVRNALELLSTCFSARLTILETSAEQQGRERLVDFRRAVASAIQLDDAPLPALLTELEKVTAALDAQGLAVRLEGQWFVRGATPTPEQLSKLAAWLQESEANPIYSTQALSRDYKGGEAIRGTASGLLAVSITGRFEDMVMWFRPEAAQVVKWGGDPGETVVFDADRKNYHPRRSFQIWKESVSLHSFPWEVPERAAADDIRQALAEAMLTLRTARLKTLSGILPICACCKKIRDEQDSWRVVEEYIQARSKATFSHGLCPGCYADLLKSEGLEDALNT